MNKNININNKPLKCVITNNESAIKYFSSLGINKEPYAGTLIIVDKSGDEDEPNGKKKIYLNEKFLAGGYGFQEEEIISTLERIAQDYDTTIEEINTTENLNIENAWEGINNKLDKNGSNADATNVYFIYNDTNNNHKLYIDEIIELLSKTPQYKDLEVTSIKLKANYVDYYGNSNTSTEIIDYENIENFTLPINTKLKSISGLLKMETNHSGGVSKLDILYKTHRTDNDLKTARYSINSYNSDIINCEFTIRLNTNDPYIIGEENNIIDSIILNNVLETPPSKYQKVQIGTEEKNNIKNIIYTANTIKEHQKTIDFPTIKGDYYITYSYSKNSNPDLNSLNGTTLFGTKLLSKINVNNDNKNKFTYINLEKNITKIVLLLPYRFSIRQALLVKDSDEISITNFLNCYKYNNGNFIQNNLKSNLYYIYISNGLKNNYTLKLDIVEDSSITYDDMNNNNEENELTNIISIIFFLTDQLYFRWR